MKSKTIENKDTSLEQKEPTLSERVAQLPEAFQNGFNQVFDFDDDLNTIGSMLNVVVGYVAHCKKDHYENINANNSAVMAGAGAWPAIQKLEVLIEGTTTGFNKIFRTYNNERLAFVKKAEEEIVVKKEEKKEENGSK